MRFIIKSLLWLVLSCLLLVGVGVVTVPWWGPPVFKQSAPKVLRHVGFSEADLSLEQIGFSQLGLKMKRLSYHGARISDAGLKLEYNFKGLRRSELEQVTLAHPEVEVDLSYDWPPVQAAGPDDRQTMGDKLPERFPIKNVRIDGASFALKGTDWSRTVALDAELTGRERLVGKVALTGEGIQIDAQADALWSELSGRVTASAKVDELADRVEFCRDRGWLNLPEDFVLTDGSVEIEAGAGFAEQALKDWNVELLYKGVAASMATSRISAEQMKLDARGVGPEIGHLDLKVSHGTAGHEELNVSFDQLLASASSAEQIGLRLLGWELTWSDGEGRLSGLAGDVKVASLMPLAIRGTQTLQFASVEQGEFATGSGQLRLSNANDREAEAPLQLEIETTALGGKVRILVDGQISDPLALSVRVFLDSVQLGDIAALFPQFEGQIEGVASGELALRLKGGEIFLQPGGLRLVAGTTGRFEYLRQGWLTQNPDLSPEAFVSGRDILEIMKDPQGATALTELAMRDLKMSAFQLQIQEAETGEQSLLAEIKGNRTIKGVTVPVVLNVPIRGDVKETINAVFEFNSRM